MLKVAPLLAGQDRADADGAELAEVGVTEPDTELDEIKLEDVRTDELTGADEGDEVEVKPGIGVAVVTTTTVVVATEEEEDDDEMGDGEDDELGDEMGDELEDELSVGETVDTTTTVVVATEDEENDGTGAELEEELGDGVAVETTTTVVVDTGVDEDGTIRVGDELEELARVDVLEDVGHEVMVCVKGLVTGKVTVAVLVFVLVEEAEVTVVVAAG